MKAARHGQSLFRMRVSKWKDYRPLATHSCTSANSTPLYLTRTAGSC